MDKEIFQIPGEIISDKSMANGCRRFTIETAETKPEYLKRLMEVEGKTGYFTFSVRKIEAVDLTNLPKINTALYPKKKTPSERLRAVIYLAWNQLPSEGRLDFIDYYNKVMEGFIDGIKERLS